MRKSSLLTFPTVFIHSFCQQQQKKQRKAAARQPTRSACARAPRVPVVPACESPPAFIAAMADAGAQKDDVEGEDLRVVQINGVYSDAWRVYEHWACSLGKIESLVQAVPAPTGDMLRSASCPPAGLAFQIHTDATNINHMAPLVIGDFDAGMPALPGPLPAPLMMTNDRHATVVVTALL